MTQPLPDGSTRSSRVVFTILAVVAPVAVATAWIIVLNIRFDETFEHLSYHAYFVEILQTLVVALGIPILVLLHSLVVRLRNRQHPFLRRAVISGAISVVVALPMLFVAVPLIAFQINLGHPPTAEESAVSSASLVSRAHTLAEASAARAGEPVTRRDPTVPIACELSNGHGGHAFRITIRMTAPPTAAATSAILSYWKSLGYVVTRTETRYTTLQHDRLSPELEVFPQVFAITVDTGCVVH